VEFAPLISPHGSLIPWLDGAREVEIALPGAWRIGGALAGRLRAIPGARDVREV
jgi:hypothetical protein